MSLWYNCGNGFVKTSWAKTDMGLDAYLVCPGPSLKEVDFDIRGKGRKVLGINTSYPKVIPDIWMGMDGLNCYDKNLWYEPFPKVLRGNYSNLELNNNPIKFFPEVYFADVAILKEGETIFNQRAHETRFIWAKNTLAVALHMFIWMGARTIHFVGCDLGGSADYYDDRVLPDSSKSYNSRLYKSQIHFLKDFHQEALKRAIRCISCTPDSPINKFMESCPLEEAMVNTEKRHTYIRKEPIHHVLEKEQEERHIVHVINYAIWGGVQSCALAISKEYSEYKHHFLILKSNKVCSASINLMTQSGVTVHKCSEELPFEGIVSNLQPEAVFLHTTGVTQIKQGYKFPEKTCVIRVHHGSEIGYIDCDIDWYVNEIIKNKYKHKTKKEFVLPPVITAANFINVKRPERKPVIGKINSATRISNRGPLPENLDSLIKQTGADCFIVGPINWSNPPKDAIIAPIVPGATAEYLRHIDIFAAWQEKYETWGLAATEAMLSGIPVVAKDNNDGMKEQLEKSGGGYLVSTEEELVEKLKELIANKALRDTLGKRGQKWCLENCDSSALRKHLPL
jgi:glycosyltransferase involved in cell wall biosynthesis